MLVQVAAIVMLACGVTPEQHTANVAEATQYGADLAKCRRDAREAKKDGGAEAYMRVYEACAQKEDAKHGVTFSDAGKP